MTEPAASVTASPLDALRDLFGPQLESLAGGVISGEVPLTVDVVNRVIARQLSRLNVPLAAADVEPGADDTFAVRLRPKIPVPAVTIDFAIEQQPQLPGRPALGLRWSLRGMGPLSLFAGPVLGYFKALPPWARVEHDRLWVDIPAVLRAQGLGDVAALLTGIRVLTRERRFVIQFELRR